MRSIPTRISSNATASRLQQLQNAIANCNANVGGDYLFQGPVVENVRSIGLIGGGLDPMQAKRLFEAKDLPHGGRLPARRREPPAPRNPHRS